MNTFIFCALIMVWTCLSSAGSNNFRNYKENGYQVDHREVQRQNKITEQILQNYLEKKLFPHRHKTSRTPSVWDILPKTRRRTVDSIQDQLRDVTPRNESLESGESENVQTVYDDIEDNEIEEGMILFCLKSGAWDLGSGVKFHDDFFRKKIKYCPKKLK